MLFDVLDYKGALPSQLRGDAVLTGIAQADRSGGVASVVVLAAAVGFALQAAEKVDRRKASGLALPSFAAHNADVFAYGEEVFDVLAEAGHSRRDIGKAGNAILDRILDARPEPVTEEDLEEALDPTEAPAGPSTSSGGASAPSTSAT